MNKSFAKVIFMAVIAILAAMLLPALALPLPIQNGVLTGNLNVNGQAVTNVGNITFVDGTVQSTAGGGANGNGTNAWATNATYATYAGLATNANNAITAGTAGSATNATYATYAQMATSATTAAYAAVAGATTPWNGTGSGGVYPAVTVWLAGANALYPSGQAGNDGTWVSTGSALFLQ